MPFLLRDGILYIILPVSGRVLRMLTITKPFFMPISLICAPLKSNIFSVSVCDNS